MFGVILNTYIVNIQNWSPSSSVGSPSNSIGSPSSSVGSPSSSIGSPCHCTVYRPTMSTTPTDLEDNGKKYNNIHVFNM